MRVGSMEACLFCLKKVSKLHQNSHIMPEWMHKDCYTENHKALLLSFRTSTAIKVQRGIRGSFLCNDCEISFCKDDTYGSHLLAGNSFINKVHGDVSLKTSHYFEGNFKRNLTRVEGINFKKLQDFILSMVMRQHLYLISKGETLLNEFHYEAIKSLYLNKATLNDFSYPIIIYILDASDSVVLPYLAMVKGNRIVRFKGGGYFFDVYVSKHNKPDYVNMARLKKDGTLLVLHMEDKELGMTKAAIPVLKEINKLHKPRIDKMFNLN